MNFNFSNTTNDVAESEYSAQYFGFTPEMFYRQFCELVLDEMSLVFQHSMKELTSSEDKDILLKNSLDIHKRWSERAENNLKELQPIIKEFFTIPKNVLLPCDQSQATQYTEEDIKKLEEEVKVLKTKYLEEMNLVAMYKAELDLLQLMEPVKGKVEKCLTKVDDLSVALKEIKEVEKMAQELNDYRKLLDKNDVDDSLKIQEKRFCLK